ncbi:MAG: DsbA family protein [Hasllibacter sp.]
MNTKIVLPAAAAAAILAAGGWWATAGGDAPAALDPAALAQDASDADLSRVRDIVLGPEDAPVTVIEYASFTCPYCARFHDEVLPVLEEEYIDAGQVRFEYREVYFDRYGLWAGMVARCDDAGAYMEVADLLYERQSEWTDGTPAQVAANLKAIGVEAGIDAEAVDACLMDAEMAEALVATYEANAAADGVRSTPSFVIDGEMMQNMPLDEFREVLDAAIAE